MNLPDFDFDPTPKNPNQILDTIFQFMIGMVLEDVEKTLVAKLAARFPGEQVDASYVDRFACAMYAMCITMPYALISAVGGAIPLTAMLMDKNSKLTPAALTEKLRKGFGKISPSMMTAITEETVVLTARLCLNDWLNNGFPSEKQMHTDMHMYFLGMLDRNSDIDIMKVKLEGQQHVRSMSPAEQAMIPHETLNTILNWKPEDDQTPE